MMINQDHTENHSLAIAELNSECCGKLNSNACIIKCSFDFKCVIDMFVLCIGTSLHCQQPNDKTHWSAQQSKHSISKIYLRKLKRECIGLTTLSTR